MGMTPAEPANIAQELASPARLKKELGDWLASKNDDGDATFPLGLISRRLAATLKKDKVPPDTTDLDRLATLTRGGLKHATRDPKLHRDAALDKDDLLRLPEIIANPEQVLEDTQHPDIWLFIFTPANRLGKKGKVVIQTQFADRLHLGLHPKNRFISHSFRTAGYVEPSNLQEDRYKVVGE